MAGPPLQPYLWFLYINKTKAAPPLKVLGVYCLNLLPRGAAGDPNILLFKLGCADSDLRQDARQLKPPSLSLGESTQTSSCTGF